MVRLLRLLVGVTVAAAFVPQPTSAAETRSLGKRGPLRVVVFPEPERPEFFSVDPKQNPGFEREILEGFAKAHKLQIELVIVPKWDALLPTLEEGKADLIAGHFTDTPERQTHADFTQPLIPTRSVVITRKPHPVITNVKQLQSLEKIGAVRAAATYEDLIAAGVPKANIDDTITPNNMLEQLKAGKVDAIVRSLALAVLSQRDDPELQLGMFLGSGSSFAFGLRKGDDALREALNAHIELLRQTGQWNRLVVKYFGPSAVDILKKAHAQ